jgi:hypothetical protein
LKFFEDLKREFPLSTDKGAKAEMPPQQLLQRLEKIAPGFQAWGGTFSSPSDAR